MIDQKQIEELTDELMSSEPNTQTEHANRYTRRCSWCGVEIIFRGDPSDIQDENDIWCGYCRGYVASDNREKQNDQ